MGMNYLNWKSGKKVEKSAIAQDESLAEHDKKYHPDGFDPKKDECKLREMMAAEGKKDEIESGEMKGFKVGDRVKQKNIIGGSESTIIAVGTGFHGEPIYKLSGHMYPYEWYKEHEIVAADSEDK